MISINGVEKRFPNERAIAYKDIVFETGKSYMLLGASGCGKSTLLRLPARSPATAARQIRVEQ